MLLSSTYFGPVEWYARLWQQRGGAVAIEACETFPKQTYRNRMVIAAEGGPLALSIPVEGTSAKHQVIRDLRIAEHGRWRHLHWQTLLSAYGDSPFFEYYADDLRPFYFDCGRASPSRLHFLLDYNEAGTALMCRLLDIDTRLTRTTEFTPVAEERRFSTCVTGGAGIPACVTAPASPRVPRVSAESRARLNAAPQQQDFRFSITPKRPSTYTARPYWQVYRQRHGFLPNLSILDLLFCQGPEAVLYL